MKLVVKIALALFSIITLVISVIGCFLVFGWLQVASLAALIIVILGNATLKTILLAVSIISILLALRCIFFEVEKKEKIRVRDGILLENSDGKLLITKDTIENLINNTAKEFENIERVTSRIELEGTENNLIVNMILTVKQGTVIKDLSNNLQQRIKEVIKRATDLEVKGVNISIRNVANI